jgi:hypothetical protein
MGQNWCGKIKCENGEVVRKKVEVEGPIGRPERGSEWEPIKILPKA